MCKLTIALTFGSVFVAGVMTVPSLYAEGSHHSSGSMMGNEMMMRDKDKKDDGELMGNMGSMMKMMNQMSQMMDQCNNMMSDNRPNDRWQKNAPSGPEKNG